MDPSIWVTRISGKKPPPFFVNTSPTQISEPTDASLLQQAGKGDKGAFRILYRRLSKTLYSIAYKFTGNAADADELMQETLLELWKQAPSYDEERSQPLTFATRIIRNRAIDRIRKKTRRERITGESVPDILESTQSKQNQSAFDSLRASEVAQTVRSALGILPEEQRNVLELAYFGGLSQSEIASQESQALGTVKSRMRRAMDKLREELEGKL